MTVKLIDCGCGWQVASVSLPPRYLLRAARVECANCGGTGPERADVSETIAHREAGRAWNYQRRRDLRGAARSA